MPVFIPEPRNLPELPPSPKVSIAITSYNYGSFLAECLDSCLAQTVRADEIVVVDDGSTDDTQRILQDYMARFPSVIGIHQVNRGIVGATNTALTNCTGDVVLLLDADDILLPQRVEKVVRALRETIDGHRPGWVHHYLLRFTREQPEQGPVPRYADAAPQGLLAAQVLATGDSPVATPTSGLAFRRELLAAMLPLDDGRHMLQDLQLRTGAALLSPLAWIPEPLTRYRIHATNRTAGLMVNVDQIGRARRGHADLDAWVRRVLDRHQPGLTSSLPPLDQQPGYLWLCYLHRWLSGERRDYGLLHKVLKHPATRRASSQLRLYYYSGLVLPRREFVAFSDLLFGFSPIKSFLRKALGRA